MLLVWPWRSTGPFRSQCVVLAVRMAGVVVAVTGALVVIFIICVDEVTIVECW
jgi:hypothetical protein